MEKAVDMVKRKLWTFGYSVKDVSDMGLPYDLIVNKKYQCKVLLFGGDFEGIVRKIIVAVVDGDEISYNVWRSNKCEIEKSPLKAFPKIKN